MRLSDLGVNLSFHAATSHYSSTFDPPHPSVLITLTRELSAPSPFNRKITPTNLPTGREESAPLPYSFCYFPTAAMGCGASTPDQTTKAPVAAKPTLAAAQPAPAAAKSAPAAAKSAPPAPPTPPTTLQAPATVEPAVTVDLKVNSEDGVSAVVAVTPTKAAPPPTAAVDAAPVAPAAAPAAAGGGGNSCVLRVICVNDVYEMDHMPRLKTAVKELRTDNTVVILAGDFLAPSLLSSLDSGEAFLPSTSPTFDIQCPAFKVQRSTCNVQCARFNVQRAIRNLQRLSILPIQRLTDRKKSTETSRK